MDGENALVTGRSGLHRPHIAHRLSRVPAEELGGVDRLPLCLRQRLSHLADDELGEIVGALRHGGEGAAQDLAPLLWGARRPLPLGGRGGVHRCLGVFFGGTRHRSDRLRRRRVEHLDLGAVRCPPPLAPDVEAGAAVAVKLVEQAHHVLRIFGQLKPSETSRFSGDKVRPAPSASKLSMAAKSWSP